MQGPDTSGDGEQNPASRSYIESQIRSAKLVGCRGIIVPDHAQNKAQEVLAEMRVSIAVKTQSDRDGVSS